MFLHCEVTRDRQLNTMSTDLGDTCNCILFEDLRLYVVDMVVAN